MKILTKIFLIIIIYGLFVQLNAQNIKSGTLPVELIYFYAEVYEDSVLLKWGTATETSNYGYDVERSINNINFQAIGFVEGSGNSNSPKHYTYSDSLVEMSGLVYYRLKQIDFIGTFEYTDTVMVDFTSSVIQVSSDVPSKFSVSNNFPNPFNPLTKINFELPFRQSLNIDLYDIGGKLVKKVTSQEFLTGSYQLSLDFSDYSSGIYFVRFESQKNVVTQKITFVK